jgi:malate dehydrogenase (oxaloacetate-decarboxylating)
MADKAIVFALANPIPEIMPEEALKGGAAVVATGRSDFPNQINNALAYPGVFKGVLEARRPHITESMKRAAAEALAQYVKNPSAEAIVPDILDRGVVRAIADAVKNS